MPACRSVPAAAMPPIPAPTIATLGVAMILLLLTSGDGCASPFAPNIDLATRNVKYIFATKLIFYKYVLSAREWRHGAQAFALCRCGPPVSDCRPGAPPPQHATN